jgi:hypothetical protein
MAPPGPKRVKRVMALPINGIFGHLQVSGGENAQTGATWGRDKSFLTPLFIFVFHVTATPSLACS